MNDDIQKPTLILIFTSFLAIFFVAVFVSAAYVFDTRQPKKEIATAHVRTPEAEPHSPGPFEDISLEAKAAYVFDIRTKKELFALNEESQLPLASLTKVMTALVASKISEDTVVPFSAGEKWRLKELLEYTLVVSSNEGASAIAGAGGVFFGGGIKKEDADSRDIFVQNMNAEARTLHLSQTFFLNPSGLDVNGSLSGAYGSAKDTALLLAHILEHAPSLMEATAYESLRFASLSGVSRTAQNTNVIARTIPGLLASKTGYTELAGGNLAVVFDVGPMRPVAVVVLGSSQEGRFTDVENLINASIASIAQK